VIKVSFDSDHAGCLDSRRSTSGMVSKVIGKYGTDIRVAEHAKRQGNIGYATADAELVAGVGAAKVSIKHHFLICKLLGFDVPLIYEGDNAAACSAIRAGYSDKLAYMKKTQGISIAWAHTNMSNFLEQIPSDKNVADSMTKALPKNTFERLRTMLGVVPVPSL
jgi:hypothetical protein